MLLKRNGKWRCSFLFDSSTFGRIKVTKVNKKSDTKQARVDDKSAYIVQKPPNGFVDILKMALLIGVTSPPISSSERNATDIR